MQLALVVGPYVHEDVEGRADPIWFYAEGGEGVNEVGEAAGMCRTVEVGVKQIEGLLTAGREEEVVAATAVGHDGEHRPAPVAVEHVAGGQVDPVGVVDAAAAAEPLVAIRCRNGEEVADLPPEGSTTVSVCPRRSRKPVPVCGASRLTRRSRWVPVAPSRIQHFARSTAGPPRGVRSHQPRG